MGSTQPENMSLGTPDARGSFSERKKLNFGHFQTQLLGHLGLFWGLSTPFTGGKQAQHDQKAAHTLPKWILSQGTATRLQWCSPRAIGPHWGLFLGPNDTVDRLKTGKTRLKGIARVARMDSVPRHGHRTPPAPIPKLSGPIWSHLGAKLANERTPRAEKVGATGPLGWLLGVPGPIQGPNNPNGEFQFLAPLWGCLLLPAAAAAACCC